MNPSSRLVKSAWLIGLLCWFGQPVTAAVVWNVDSSQSYLRWVIPDVPLPFPLLNLTVTNQGSATGAWTQGNQAAIAGTLATEFENGVSIHFLVGQHQLTAENSGSYAPDFDTWDSDLEQFIPPEAIAPAAFGGQYNPGFEDVWRWAVRDVGYDLGSGVIPLALNTFSADATMFAMTEALVGSRGRPPEPPNFPGSPSEFGDLNDLENISVGGTNAAAAATITQQNGLLVLTLPISVPLFFGQIGADESAIPITGIAEGVIVATTPVPEPDTLALGTSAVAVFLAWFRRRRKSESARNL